MPPGMDKVKAQREKISPLAMMCEEAYYAEKKRKAVMKRRRQRLKRFMILLAVGQPARSSERNILERNLPNRAGGRPITNGDLTSVMVKV